MVQVMYKGVTLKMITCNRLNHLTVDKEDLYIGEPESFELKEVLMMMHSSNWVEFGSMLSYSHSFILSRLLILA